MEALIWNSNLGRALDRETLSPLPISSCGRGIVRQAVDKDMLQSVEVGTKKVKVNATFYG